MRNRCGTPGFVASLLVAAAATTACPSSKPDSNLGATAGLQPSVTVSSFDGFNKDLAKRVTDVLVPGGAADFQVVVTPAMDPIGTLYQKGRSVPYDDKACVPSTEPAARNMPSVFPSYQLDAKVAAEFGLDESILQGFADVGAGVASGSSFTFSVLNPQLKALSDTAIQQVLVDAMCATARKLDLLIVRGYVSGQRRFSTKSDGSASANAAAAKIGKFDVRGSNAGLLSITDEAPQAANVAAPQPVSGVGQIFVQQDQADDAQKGKQVLGMLANAGFKVEKRVEQVASKATPDQPQVRYFNETDKARAASVLSTLQQQYPDAKLVPLAIHAPQGQLEVWLPRAK
jgi:hypothetical protein